jgi:hypothetical protein
MDRGYKVKCFRSLVSGRFTSRYARSRAAFGAHGAAFSAHVGGAAVVIALFAVSSGRYHRPTVSLSRLCSNALTAGNYWHEVSDWAHHPKTDTWARSLRAVSGALTTSRSWRDRRIGGRFGYSDLKEAALRGSMRWLSISLNLSVATSARRPPGA